MRFQDNVLTTLNSAITTLSLELIVDVPGGPYNAPMDPAGSLASLTLVDSLVSPTKIETVLYTGRTGTGPYTLTGVVRGVVPYDWPAGARVYQAIRSSDILSETSAEKTSLVGADIVGLLDSAAQYVLKRFTLSNLKAFIGASLHLVSYDEEVTSPAISAGVLTLDLNTSGIFNVAHTSNIDSLVINNAVPGKSFTLNLTQDATGGRALVLPASCRYSEGSTLQFTTLANKRNKLVFDTLDGTNFDVALVGKNYA